MFLVGDVVPSRHPANPSQDESDRLQGHTQTHDAPVVLREKPSPTEIAPQQVLAADVISRAPGVFVVENRVRIEGFVTRRNSDTARSESVSRPDGTPCKPLMVWARGYENKSPQVTRAAGSEDEKAGRTVERSTASRIK